MVDTYIGIRYAKPPAYAKHSLSRIFVDYKKQVKRNIFLTTTFLQRLSHNVFLTTSFSQSLSHNVFPSASFSHRCSHTVHIRPHNVVLTTSQYTRNVSLLYTNLKISHICLSSDPVISTCFYLKNWNLDVAHLQYILCHCVKFQNPRTKALYQSAADKVLYD